MSGATPLSAEAVRAILERLGLDPNGVDLEWIARVKHDTEQRIAEYRNGPAFAAASAISSLPPQE